VEQRRDREKAEKSREVPHQGLAPNLLAHVELYVSLERGARILDRINSQVKVTSGN